MNTSDLRETLASHATFEDDAVTARVVGVRERVRVVRRRRRAAVGGAVAAVLAIGAAGVAIPKLTNSAEPASRELAGHTAPATLESLGYTYEFTRGVEGDGKAVLDLAKSDEPRLVTWATEGDNDKVFLSVDGVQRRLTIPDFSDFVLVSEGASRRVSVGGKGKVAMAVYQVSNLPNGTVSDMGVTFPPTMLGARLLGVKFGKPGETEIEVPYVMPETGVDLVPLCEAPRGFFVGSSEDLGVGADIYSDCANGSSYIGWTGSSTQIEDPFPGDVEPGDRLTAEAWLAKEHVRQDSVPGARIGLAVYERVPLVATPGASRDVPQFAEFEGHVWRHHKTVVQGPDGYLPSISVPASAGQILVFTVNRDGASDGWSGEWSISGDSYLWKGPPEREGGDPRQASTYLRVD